MTDRDKRVIDNLESFIKDGSITKAELNNAIEKIKNILFKNRADKKPNSSHKSEMDLDKERRNNYTLRRMQDQLNDMIRQLREEKELTGHHRARATHFTYQRDRAMSDIEDLKRELSGNRTSKDDIKDLNNIVFSRTLVAIVGWGSLIMYVLITT